MASPNISIVIPNYGYGRFFARLAEDLACQTFGLDSVEILLVDDGSIDDSRREAAHLEALPTHTFAAFWLDHCGAPGTVRNHGLERSRGNLLLCLDPDDRLASGFLESCVMALDGHPEASLAYSDYIYEDSSGARTVSLPSFDPGLLRNQNILPPCALLRRRVLDDCGGYRDNTTYEDWDLWVRAAAAGHTGVRVPVPLYTHVIHGDNFSFAARREDGRAKAAIVLNSPGFFPAGVRHWAQAVMDGEPWAHAFPRGIIPGLDDVKTLLDIRRRVEAGEG